MLKVTALVALACSLVVGADSAIVDCTGCAASGGVGLANPATPNLPNSNGTTNPPSGASPGSIAKASIVDPPTASGSWRLEKSGNGTVFESGAGTCKPNTSPSEDAPCVQNTSCTWKLKDTSASGDSTLTIKVISKSPSGGGTTGPSVSGNFTQNPTAIPTEWSVSFSSADAPMSPRCGGEIEYVVCWNDSGTPQRWELSFRCDPCVPKPVDPDGDGEGGDGGGGGGNDGDGTGG